MGWSKRRRAITYVFALIWLIFLAFPIANLFDGHHPRAEIAGSIFAVTVFCLVYAWHWVRLSDCDIGGILVGLVSLTAIATLMTLASGSDWGTLFIYVAAATGGSFSTWRRGVPGVAAVSLLSVALAILEGAPPIFVAFVLIEVPMIGLAVMASGFLVRTNQALNEAREEVAQLAVAEERLRFSRDLHDLLGHSLSVIVLKAELARRLGGRSPERAAAEVADIERVARQALTEVREAVAGYRAASLSDELQEARSALAAAGVRVRVEQSQLALPVPVDHVLAWALREGVTNVVRHAGASAASICLNRTADRAELELTDDGRGGDSFEPGNGLRGLRERVVGRQGDVEFGPRPVGGWRLLVTVPLIRVLLAEDQDLVRGALAALLSLEPDIEVVAEVNRGDQVLPAAREHRPQVALLDIEMPGQDGIAAAAELRRELPDCRVLILTTFGRPGFLRRAMAAGASGFMLKDARAEELAVAIRRTAAGERVVDPSLAAQALSDGESPLSPREAEVLGAFAGGATVSDVAVRMFLSEGTVRNHLSNAIQKLNARNRTEAARIALDKGWL
jgi:two-component system response regulator DesR